MFRYNSQGGFNVPYGNAYNSKNISKKVEVLKSEAVKEKLEDCKFYNEDFEKFLNRFTFSNNDFIFLDPPYHCTFTDYDKSPFTLEDQTRLCQWLKNCRAKFMLIIASSKEVDGLYKEFNVKSYDFTYLFNIKGRNSKKAKHLLISNY